MGRWLRRLGVARAPATLDSAALDPADLERTLWRDAFDVWFPRCLDQARGGYLCDFDARWRPDGPQDKMLEFQARQTRVAALGCRLRPGDPAWERACRHGYAFLRDTMRDRERGGWYACLDRDGRPLEGGDKHTHGIAYAIHACLDVGRTLGEPEALGLAREGLHWLDAVAWDRERGGYWGWLHPDGVPYGVRPAEAPRRQDHMGTPVGAKDINVQGDMIETLTELHHRLGDALAGERLRALVALFEGLTRDTGRLPVVLTPELVPLTGIANAGLEVQACHRLPLARAVLGEPLTRGPVERTLHAHALTQRGPTGGVVTLGGQEEWWAQMEVIRAGALAAVVDPESRELHLAETARHWDYVRRTLVDPVHAGLFQVPPRRGHAPRKGTRWKDASHEAFALVAAVRALRRADEGPLTLASDPWA
jgi:mannose/cellobiose epimerase-like protein (N-acyl-D-glucosamine 2-epimerase family)